MAHAMLFELEGVLVETEPLWRPALAGALEMQGLVVDARAVADGEGWPLRARVARLLPDPLVDETTRDLVVLEASRRFMADARRGIALRPGARELLEDARASVRVAAVTRLRRTEAEPLLELASVGELVEFVVAAEDAAPKPAADPYRAALSRLARLGRIGHRDVLALEDSMTGVMAARGAGVACILVGSRHVGDIEDVVVVPSLGGHDLRSLWPLVAPEIARVG